MRWKKQLLSMKPYQPGKSIEEVKKQYGLESITKLASNENPFGCSQKVTQAIKQYEKRFGSLSGWLCYGFKSEACRVR